MPVTRWGTSSSLFNSEGKYSPDALRSGDFALYQRKVTPIRATLSIVAPFLEWRSHPEKFDKHRDIFSTNEFLSLTRTRENTRSFKSSLQFSTLPPRYFGKPRLRGHERSRDSPLNPEGTRKNLDDEPG